MDKKCSVCCQTNDDSTGKCRFCGGAYEEEAPKEVPKDGPPATAGVTVIPSVSATGNSDPSSAADRMAQAFPSTPAKT